MTKWNPRYVAYAADFDKTPEERLETDAVEWPGGKMTGFILWMKERIGEFKHISPKAFIGDWLSDQDTFDAWLAGRAKNQ
jgi:hypothetical protein